MFELIVDEQMLNVVEQLMMFNFLKIFNDDFHLMN
jgi:hypothetical protein